MFSQITPVVKWLLIVNLALYFLETLLKGDQIDGPIRAIGEFRIQSGFIEGHIWEFVTFQFLHGSVLHVLLNCMGIFFFGPWLERWWGSGKFLVFYLLCGVAGAVFFTLLFFIGLLPSAGLESPLVGASAGIYGILIGVATIAPNLRVALLFPPVVVSMRQAAIALMVIAVGVILLGYIGVNPFGLVDNEGGQAGHLGGAILGFFLIRFPWLLGGQGRPNITRPRATTPPPLAKLRPRSELEMQQDSAMDVILDKISREGFQSLTPEERDFLQKASSHTKPT